MRRIRLIHTNAKEAAAGIERLRKTGFAVEHGTVVGPALLADLRHRPPDALVIDLTRMPSLGRDLALTVRSHAATRHVPIVFAGGEPGKTAAIRRLLPDAVFTPWARAGAATARAIARPPARPVVPGSVMAGYSGTPLPKKLGIKAGMRVCLAGAPPRFDRTLGALPEGAVLVTGARAAHDLTIWFPRSLADLRRRVGPIGARAGAAGLWIAWPKKSSGIATDLTQTAVRRHGLDAGLVDYKICAIDETWSGLKFARRRS